MATRNRKTNGKGSAEESKREERQIQALPFVGTAKDKTRDFWAVPKRGGYVGGCMTGEAAAMAYLNFLRDNSGCGGPGMLQCIALDMFVGPRSDSLMGQSASLRGQAVGFFSHLDKVLCSVAPFWDIEQDDQIRAKFRRGLKMNGPRTEAYIKELCRRSHHEHTPKAKEVQS
jgi:hypothetical protein